MKIEPFKYHIQCPSWQSSGNNPTFYCNNSLIILVLYVKVWRIMLTHIHIDGYPIEIAYFWHSNWLVFGFGKLGAYLGLDLVAELHVIGKELLAGVTALGELAFTVAEPASALLDDIHIGGKIENFAYA